MAYYDQSIEDVQALIDALEKRARTIHSTDTIQTTKIAGLIRAGIGPLKEARDLMLVSNYVKERSRRGPQ